MNKRYQHSNPIPKKMPRQSVDVLRFIHNFTNEKVYCPVIREICDGVGIVSTGQVGVIIQWLIRHELCDGVILESGIVSGRTVHVTQKGIELLKSLDEE